MVTATASDRATMAARQLRGAMRTAADFVPDAATGSTTVIDIAAGPHAVWRALYEVRLGDLPLTTTLLAVRALPALLRRRGALQVHRDDLATRAVVAAMTAGRFTILYREPGRALTMGIVGQFWRLAGGTDVPVRDPTAFVAFREPGYVKTAIDVILEPHPGGCLLSTRTRSRGTDAAAERRFRRYWRLVGPGSKLIRIELLRAVRRRAEEIAVVD